jgi:hypothetical protein
VNAELPRITKRELARVGVVIPEDTVRAWLTRGWRELELYLWRSDRVEEQQRVFEEDGA